MDDNANDDGVGEEEEENNDDGEEEEEEDDEECGHEEGIDDGGDFVTTIHTLQQILCHQNDMVLQADCFGRH